jgi:hypothetical protein
MALDLPPLLQPPLAGLVPPADWRKSVAYPATERPVEPTDADVETADSEASSEFRNIESDEPNELTRIDARPTYPSRPGQFGDSRSWDQPRPIYNPRGAPSDATPALSRLEARIAFEPVFMHQYASTCYALVSFMPTTNAERRTRYDILA